MVVVRNIEIICDHSKMLNASHVAFPIFTGVFALSMIFYWEGVGNYGVICLCFVIL